MTQRLQDKRAGALAVEAAIVYSVLFVLLFGLIAGGIGIFRYQQAACLAREGARWASVHGDDWQSDLNIAACTADQIRQQGVLPLAARMDPAALSVQVQFINRAAGTVSDWDQVGHPPTSLDAANNLVTNRVRITVTYRWTPGALLVGPLYLKSTSEMSMSY
jgi:Flp pilus assembly protein TadG